MSSTMPTSVPSSAARAVRPALASLAAVAVLALTGCANLPPGHVSPEHDPWESYNRAMFGFNEGLDKAVLKPVATVYTDVVPSPVRTGVSNASANIADVWSLVNNLLQFQWEGVYNSLVRVTVNTVLGFGGLLDIATEAGVTRHKQDFGLTLARWNVPSGPYFVIPFFGPSSVRDGVGLVADWTASPVTREIQHVPTRNSLYALWAVDKRAGLLQADEMLESMALDKYSFTRDAYLQLRARRAGHEVPDGDEGDAGRLPREDE